MGGEPLARQRGARSRAERHGWHGSAWPGGRGQDRLAWCGPALIGLMWHGWHGTARLCRAQLGRHGTERPGSAWRPRHGTPWHGATWLGFSRQARQGLTWIRNARHLVATLAVQGVASLGPAMPARRGKAGRLSAGTARHGGAVLRSASRCWLGTARPVWAPPVWHGSAAHPMASLARLRMVRVGEASSVIAR